MQDESEKLEDPEQPATDKLSSYLEPESSRLSAYECRLSDHHAHLRPFSEAQRPRTFVAVVKRLWYIFDTKGSIAQLRCNI